jgi:hypothetical protein
MGNNLSCTTICNGDNTSGIVNVEDAINVNIEDKSSLVFSMSDQLDGILASQISLQTVKDNNGMDQEMDQEHEENEEGEVYK